MLHSPPNEEVNQCGVLSAITAIAVLGLCGPPRVRAQTDSAPDWTRLNTETLQHFQALVRLDTQNPPGNEHLITDYVKSVLEKDGIPVQIFALDPKRPNLVARLKGNGKKQPLLYMGHSDVVTVDPKKWTFPPFSATRDGGYIYGRGSDDDRPHVVAGLMTMLTLKRLNVPLDRDVIFLVESGEEGTTGVGIGFMTSQHADAIAAEYCLAETGTVARVNGKVTYAGVQTVGESFLDASSSSRQVPRATPRGHCRATPSCISPPPSRPPGSGAYRCG